MAIKCDVAGNVYVACGDGIEIFNPGGVLLGLIEISGGCSNFTFGKQGEVSSPPPQTVVCLQHSAIATRWVWQLVDILRSQVTTHNSRFSKKD